MCGVVSKGFNLLGETTGINALSKGLGGKDIDSSFKSAMDSTGDFISPQAKNAEAPTVAKSQVGDPRSRMAIGTSVGGTPRKPLGSTRSGINTGV